jgi:hypothetical protein
MNSLSLYSDLDQKFKQEQYKDLLREAKHYRLIKDVARPGPNHLREVAAALRKAMVWPTALLRRFQHLPSRRPTNRARI